MRPFFNSTARWLMAPLLIGMSGVAFAEDDLLVQVPLSYSNLPEGARPTVFCHAMMEDPNGGDPIALGSAKTNFPPPEGPDDVFPPNGAPVANVVFGIEFTNFPGALPSDADYVNCTLSLMEEGTPLVHTFDRCVEDGIDPFQNPLQCGPRGAEVTSIATQRVDPAATSDGDEDEPE